MKLNVIFMEQNERIVVGFSDVRFVYVGGDTPTDYSDLVDEAIVDYSRVGESIEYIAIVGEAFVGTAVVG